MAFKLRPYQTEAVEAVLTDMKYPGNSLVVLPTGAGKSLVIAEVAKRLNSPVLVLQPSKEILFQNLQKLRQYVPHHETGIYSASFNSTQVRKYTFATIQSIYKKAALFAHFDLILIDECHSVNPKNLEGMFTSFIEEVNAIRARM